MGAVTPLLQIAAGQQANAIGKFNQSIANRNATIAEQEAAQQEKLTEFDIAKFNQSFEQMEGTTRVSLAKSGRIKWYCIKNFTIKC